MRVMGFLVLTLLFCSIARADKIPLRSYDGTQATTTDAFTVKDKWEVRWHAPGVIAVTILGADGTVVAGAAGSAKGSLYVPTGGTYTLKIASEPGQTTPWHASVVEIGTDVASADASLTSDYRPPGADATNAAPTPTAPPPPATIVAAATNAPAPNVPAVAIPDGLTEAQARAIVVIKGDMAQGTGFLVKMPDGMAVITNQHVISANPNVHILTSTGEEIKVLALKGASDRDLAEFLIQDNHYSYLEPAIDLAGTVQTGDQVITPGNSEGGGVVLNTKGKILGIGPEKIEFDNPIYHGNSGGPVFHLATGKVVGVVTEAEKVDVSDEVDKASFANKNSAIAGSMRYFGLRIDTVPKWEPYDANSFLGETTFLEKFHQESRCLDSFMNGEAYEKAHEASAGEEGAPNSNYYQHDPRIQTAADNYHKLESDADESQRMDATREIVMDLDTIADTGMTDIQNSGNFYSFDQQRAKDEIEYRKELRDEIDKVGDHLSDLGH